MTKKVRPSLLAENYFGAEQKVFWKWMGGFVSGQVVEIFFERIEKEIKGKNIVRKGSKDCPAYLVKSDAGNYALKLQTELFSEKQKMELLRAKRDLL